MPIRGNRPGIQAQLPANVESSPAPNPRPLHHPGRLRRFGEILRPNKSSRSETPPNSLFAIHCSPNTPSSTFVWATPPAAAGPSWSAGLTGWRWPWQPSAPMATSPPRRRYRRRCAMSWPTASTAWAWEPSRSSCARSRSGFTARYPNCRSRSWTTGFSTATAWSAGPCSTCRTSYLLTPTPCPEHWRG
jgi:hypothetical protein